MKRVILFAISLSLAGLCYTQNIIHVPGDQSTIQAGIDAASDGEVVLVDDGLYYENINFRGKAITVASLYWQDGDTSHITNTIIDGSQPANPDSASVVYFINGEENSSVLHGFTIQGGSGTLGSFLSGGGIYCWGTGPIIEYNHIINNKLDGPRSSGAGISATAGSTKNLIIRNNYISSDSCISYQYEVLGGGITISNLGECQITENVIVDNYIYSYDHWAEGAGIYAINSEITIKNNIIDSNEAVTETGNWAPWGGGIYVETEDNSVIQSNKIRNNMISSAHNDKGGGIGVYRNEGHLLIDANFIHGNTARQGAGISIALEDTLIISNNVIDSNYTNSEGGGIYITEFNVGEISPVIVNNTIVNNGPSTYSSAGGGISYDYSLPLIAFNNIIYNNSTTSSKEVNMRDSSSGYFYNNDLDESKVTGNGTINYMDNFYSDPLFCDDSCHLNCWIYSPCINTGLPELEITGIGIFQAPEYDLDGEIRPQDGLIDIGAFEETICVSVDEYSGTKAHIDINVFPNPVSGYADIRYSILETRDSKLAIYDAYGRLIETLVDEVQQAGEHVVRWNAEGLPSGIYIYRLTDGDEAVSGKIFVK